MKRGVDLAEVEDHMLDLIILHFFPLRPDGKRSGTMGQMIRAVFALLVRYGRMDPKKAHPTTGKPIPPEEYQGWDARSGLYQE